VILCSISTHGRADSVTLHSGRVITGTVETEGPRQVTVRTSAGLLSFENGQVARVERSSKESNQRAAVLSYLQKGDLDTALGLLGEKAQAPGTIALLLQHKEAILRAAPRHLKSSADSLAAAVATPAATQGEILFAAQYMAGRKEYEKAATYLVQLRPSVLAPDERKAAVDVVAACGEWLVRNPQHEVAMGTLTLLRDPQFGTSAGSATVLLQFSAAQELARRGNFLQAVEMTRAIDGPGKASLLRQHLDSLLEQATKSADKAVAADVAGAILEHFSQWFSGARRAELIRTAALAHAANGNYSAATQLADGLSKEDADAGANLAHRIEFLKRRADTLDKNDPVATYKLAVWAREMGLLDEANTLLGSLSSEVTMAENVRLQLQILELDRGKRELDEIRKQYGAGKYDEAQKALSSFRSRYAATELQQKALELTELVRYREWTAAQRAPAQAEASYQHAERLYNQGKLAEALESANKVVAEYINTPAGDKAAVLRDKVERELKALRGRPTQESNPSP